MTDEREATLTKAFEMLLTHVLPEGAFYYAEYGLAVIMTGDCDELRNFD